MRTTKWQITRFAFIYLGAQAIIFLIPSLIASSAYQGWLGLIGGFILNLVFLLCVIYLSGLRPGEAWDSFGQEIVGKWLHGFFLVLLLCWCVYYVSFDIQNFVLFFGSNYLLGTPSWFIQILLGLVIVFTALLGFPTMVYMTDGLFLLILIATMFSMGMFAQEADFNMLPALLHYHNPAMIFKDSITVLSWLGQAVVFLFIVPDIRIDKRIFIRLLAASLLVTMVLFMGWVLTLLNLGPYLGGQMQYPFLEMIRGSKNDSLLGKIDPLLIGIWSSSLFIHSAFLVYIGTRCASRLTKGKGKKLMIPLLTCISVTIAYLYSRNAAKYSADYNSFGAVVIWLIIEAIPVLYALVGWLRFGRKAAQ